MHVSYRHIFKTLCFYSYSKLNLVNFEQPKKHIYSEKFIFTFLWLLSALGKFKHLVTLAKVFTILLLSKCSSQWPMVFRYTSFCWLKKKSQTTGYPSLLLCASTGFNTFLCYYQVALLHTESPPTVPSRMPVAGKCQEPEGCASVQRLTGSTAS